MAQGTKWDLLVNLKTKGTKNLKAMGNSMQGLQGRIKNVTASVLSLNNAFKAFAVVMTARTMSSFVKGAIDQADAFGKLSRQTGIAADTLQSYVNAGKLAGVEQATIEKSLRRLAQSMREADQGVATYSDAYEALGITVRDSDGNLKESEVLFAEIADRFRDMPDGATKAALAMEIFGRSGSQIIPMLNEGGEALEKWNYQTSEGFAANAEYFNDQVTMLGFGFDGFRKQLADELLPTLNAVMESFLELFGTENDWTSFFTAISISIRSVAFGLMSTAVALEEIGNYMSRLQRRFGRLMSGEQMDDPNAEYMTGVKERFERNKEIFAKLISGESEAGENYYQKGTDGANKLKSALDKTFGDPMKSKLSTFVNSLGDIGSQLDNLAINTITKLEDSLFTFLTEGKFKFKEFADSIIKQIIRMAIKQMIFNILAGFTNRNAAASAPVATPTTTKNALGNTFANGIQPFARGGIVTKPTLFRYQQGGQFRRGLMAEAGPEAIMPLRRGPSGRLGVEAHGGGTNISIAVDAKGSRVEGDGASAKRLGNAISEAVRKEIVHQQRPGGLL